MVKRYPGFTVFGDDGWLVDIPSERLKKAGYYDSLADVYRKSEIVVDVNRVVIRDGFTQRILMHWHAEALWSQAQNLLYMNSSTHPTTSGSGDIQEQCALTQQIDYYLSTKMR